MNALFEMIDDGDLEGVREVLVYEPELANVSQNDATPLFLACQLDHPEIATALLDAGAALLGAEAVPGRRAGVRRAVR